MALTRGNISSHRLARFAQAQAALAPGQQLAVQPALGFQPGGDVGGGRCVERHPLGQRHLVQAGFVVHRAQQRVLHRGDVATVVLGKQGHRALVSTPDQVARLSDQWQRLGGCARHEPHCSAFTDGTGVTKTRPASTRAPRV
jgi:hypothetical protein